MLLANWRRRWQAIGLVAAAFPVLAGCSTHADDKSPAPEPVGLPQSWIWSAASGLNIDSQDARTVRGWFESANLFQNASVSYPGFTQATSADLLSELMPASDGVQGGGTERLYIRSLVVSGGELRASVCSDGWDESTFTPDGQFFGAQVALALRTLVMRQSGPTTQPPSIPASGAQQALMDDTSPAPIGRTPYASWLKGPRENVFNNWIAISRAVDVTPPADCVAWFKRNHPDLSWPTGYPNDGRPNRPTSAPPPTLPASPGW
ncbi:hypothetical protein ACQPYH_06325 [Kribbella sp. CA-245084]|uniref:hypothetical protein n=1 Tax=Kribbella sp. CA-245084 TaxID=3239940 RepID=UPI003D8AD85A